LSAASTSLVSFSNITAWEIAGVVTTELTKASFKKIRSQLYNLATGIIHEEARTKHLEFIGAPKPRQNTEFQPRIPTIRLAWTKTNRWQLLKPGIKETLRLY
jgi:hypothetical protein